MESELNKWRVTRADGIASLSNTIAS